MKNKTLRYLLSIALAFIFQSCSQPKAPETEKLKIAVIRYQHETCTFCPGGDTEIADWTKNKDFLNEEEVLKADSYVKGFVHTAEQYIDVDLVGIKSPDDVFGGSSRSWNSKESFEHFMTMILNDLKSKMPVQGVYLALHGAMAVRDVPRPEAEIAKRVRELVGEDVPIAGSFDLHGNEDEEFLKWSDAAFVTKRYPHYDAFIQGGRSANFIYRAIKGNYKATTATRKPPVVTATVLQWTGQTPSMDIMERARRWEARLPDTYVSVFYGFPWSDVPDIGATVHVITNNDQHLADSIADDMAEYIWRVREEFAGGSYPMPVDAVKQTVEAIKNGNTPVALGDHSDRPGDATWILKELIDQKVEGVLYATLRDERVLDKLKAENAKPGDDFDMEVGGFTGKHAGEPVRIKGKVVFFGPKWNYENIAAIDFGNNNLLIITPAYEQILYPEELAFGGIDPDKYQVFVVKSRVHFRRGFDETGYAKTILVVDAPGSWVGTTRLDALDYQYGPINKLYPFDK
ncbi:M81 family metallopeptidase [Chondrinema litorale]|uniref:M81 family metallopeptidase n=1 Tax=Chondrinema litorale TaxID=2994555 RepID=UPI002543A0EF|nr:M81 family metallopeptidase [Chondrinema litorale]UZR96113.1 M81 family metallopeptidase [Chondrinema litorale]